MTASRESELLSLTELLLNARRNATPVDTIQEALLPTTMQEAYYVQDQMAIAFGEIGGYKIGATGPEAEPFFAPLPAIWMAPSGSVLAGDHLRLRILEGEIAFLVGSNLPPRERAYSRDEVAAAMASAHSVIEILESAYTDPKQLPRLAISADLQYHGAFVHGPAIPNWQSIDWAKESVTLTVDGVVRSEATGSNPGGTDLLRMLTYLANEGAARTGGLKAGQWVTTGSWTGNTPATPGCEVQVRFTHSEPVSFTFAR